MSEQPAYPPDRAAVLSTLNGLVETCRDGASGFQAAASAVREASLQRVFASFSQQRAEFAEELEPLVRSLGGDPAEAGHLAAAVHRGWINLKAAITGKDDAAIITECERGEDFAQHRYRKALDTMLPAEARATVERQYIQVREAHDHVRALERTYSAR
jgi:uncharacterized protein (TIGR02284 family)